MRIRQFDFWKWVGFLNTEMKQNLCHIDVEASAWQCISTDMSCQCHEGYAVIQFILIDGQYLTTAFYLEFGFFELKERNSQGMLINKKHKMWSPCKWWPSWIFKMFLYPGISGLLELMENWFCNLYTWSCTTGNFFFTIQIFFSTLTGQNVDHDLGSLPIIWQISPNLKHSPATCNVLRWCSVR